MAIVKKVDRKVLSAFILPLIITYGLTTFIFVMQFLWKYIDDIVGKGLEMSLVLQLVKLFAVIITPMSLPLAVLLASNMVIGDLAENNELTAFKASGISVIRVMSSLIVFSIVLAGSAFYFSNYVLPKVNLKFYALLYDIRKSKPALDIQEGVFYRGLSGFALKIDKKAADNQTLYGITVYDHSQNNGNKLLVLAEKGKISLSNTGQFLILELYNGKQYQYDFKRNKNNVDDNIQDEAMEMHFKSWRKVFDLNEFQMKRTDESLFKANQVMYSINQLKEQADSLNKDITSRWDNTYVTYNNLVPSNKKGIELLESNNINDTNKVAIINIDINDVYKRNFKSNTTTIANSTISNMIQTLESTEQDMGWRRAFYYSYVAEIYRKYSLSFACIVLLIVGGMMGAIVRKGGFGVPILVSVLYFVVFHVLNVTGEKLAKAEVIPMPIGMWLSTIVLLPLAIYLSYRTVNDANVFASNVFSSIKSKFKKKTTVNN